MLAKQLKDFKRKRKKEAKPKEHACQQAIYLAQPVTEQSQFVCTNSCECPTDLLLSKGNIQA